MVKRILSVILVFCIMLAPVVNVGALEDSNINTEEAKDTQKTDINNELKQDAKNISRESSQPVDVAEPVALANEAPTSGTYGPNVMWRFENGTLSIDGIGYMGYVGYYSARAPWWSFKKAIKCVNIEDGITNIGAGAFWGCEYLTDISIPDSVTYIDEKAFSGCIRLTSISIPDSVTSINDEAFSGCTGLTNISIPANTGNYAFSGCRGLTNITISNGVTIIGKHAFMGCTGLTHISIPDSVSIIWLGAFWGCNNLINISIPDSVTYIDNSVFYGCSSLTDVHYKGDNASWQDIEIGVNNALTTATIHFNSTAPDYDPSKYKVYTSKDVSPPDGCEGFDRPLEVCIRKTDATVYNPQLAHMLIAMCNSVHDETNMKKHLKVLNSIIA